jgi:hypothetical protein
MAIRDARYVFRLQPDRLDLDEELLSAETNEEAKTAGFREDRVMAYEAWTTNWPQNLIRSVERAAVKGVGLDRRPQRRAQATSGAHDHAASPCFAMPVMEEYANCL